MPIEIILTTAEPANLGSKFQLRLKKKTRAEVSFRYENVVPALAPATRSYRVENSFVAICQKSENIKIEKILKKIVKIKKKNCEGSGSKTSTKIAKQSRFFDSKFQLKFPKIGSGSVASINIFLGTF